MQQRPNWFSWIRRLDNHIVAGSIPNFFLTNISCRARKHNGHTMERFNGVKQV